MAGIWHGFRAFRERVRGEFGGGVEWVEPGNWVTRAVASGEVEPGSMPEETAAARTYELAPDNVVIATSAPRPADETPAEVVETDAATAKEKGRIARAG